LDGTFIERSRYTPFPNYKKKTTSSLIISSLTESSILLKFHFQVEIHLQQLPGVTHFTFKEQLSEDIRYEYLQTHHNDININNEYIYNNEVLIDIESKLSHYGLLNKDYGLPEPDYSSLNDEAKKALLNKELSFEMNYDKQELRNLIERNVSLFNHEQLSTYQTILESIYHEDVEMIDNDKKNEDIEAKNCHFIDAPGGTGKTFLSNTILGTVRAKR